MAGPLPDVRIRFAGPVESAREVNGQEQPVGSAKVANGAIVTSFTPYQPRTFALKLGAPPAKIHAVKSESVALPYELAVSSNDDTKSIGGFNDRGDALPAEMLAFQVDVQRRRFPTRTGRYRDARRRRRTWADDQSAGRWLQQSLYSGGFIGWRSNCHIFRRPEGLRSHN